jgi:hypothetical protein
VPQRALPFPARAEKNSAGAAFCSHPGTRAGPVLGVVVGLIWGLWHVQVIALGLAYLIGFLAGTVGMSVVLSLLLRSAGSPDLLTAGLFHLWWLASSPPGS